jgi:hypothetical protein
MIQFAASECSCKVKLNDEVSYSSSQLLTKLKAQDFRPTNGAKIGPVYFLSRVAAQSFRDFDGCASPGKFSLIGESDDRLYHASDRTEVYVVLASALETKSDDTTFNEAKDIISKDRTARGMQRVVQAKTSRRATGPLSEPKATKRTKITHPAATLGIAQPTAAKQKPYQCVCDCKWKILLPQLQECCMCKSLHHRDCMPLWLAREAVTKDSQSWYPFTAGSRPADFCKHIWVQTPPPEKYKQGATMPDSIFDTTGYQLRFDFCFVCSCEVGRDIDYAKAEEYVLSNYVVPKCRKPSCAVTLDFPEEKSAATQELVESTTSSKMVSDPEMGLTPFNVADIIVKVNGWIDLLKQVSTLVKTKTNSCVTVFFDVAETLSEKHAPAVAEMTKVYKVYRNKRHKSSMEKILDQFAPLALVAIQKGHLGIPQERLVLQFARVVTSFRPDEVPPCNSLKTGHCDLTQRELIAVVLDSDASGKQGIEFHLLSGMGFVKIKIGKLEAYYAKMSVNEYYCHLTRWLDLTEGLNWRAVLLLSFTRESLDLQTFDMQKMRCGDWLNWMKNAKGQIVEDKAAIARCATKITMEPDVEEPSQPLLPEKVLTEPHKPALNDDEATLAQAKIVRLRRKLHKAEQEDASAARTLSLATAAESAAITAQTEASAAAVAAAAVAAAPGATTFAETDSIAADTS